MADDALAESYAGAFDGRLMPGKRPALLLVDMVVAYLDPASPFFCETSAAALACAVRLRQTARMAGRPVYYTSVVYQPGGADGGLFYRKIPALSVFDEGSPLGAFPQELAPAAGEQVITKQYPSAFFGTSLAAQLSVLDVDTLVIGGFSTSGCVRASALDALQHGFAPLIVREACADRHEQPHQQNLFDLQAKYAEVIGEGEACAILG